MADAFDRAADDFTQARGLPADVTASIVQSLIEQLDPHARVADVGAGSGRIARPLLLCGMKVMGIDLSRQMLRQFGRELPPDAPESQLVQADSVHLPFADRSLDAVISVHVLQLIANWQEALAEIRRVLAAGGALFHGYEWRPADSPGATMLQRWCEIVRDNARSNGLLMDEPGMHDLSDVKTHLLVMGAGMQEWLVGEWLTRRTLARNLEAIEHRTWSKTWDALPGFFDRCLGELRAWAIGNYGPLDTEISVAHRFIWQKFWW